MKSIKYVFNGYREAFSIIERKELKLFYILPGLLSFLLIFLLYYVSSKMSFSLFTQLSGMVNLQEYSKLAYYLVRILVGIICYMVYFLLYKGVILVLLSPFLSYISERVEEDRKGTEIDISLKQNIKFIGRGVVVSSKYLLFEISGTLFILILGFIPMVNLFTPVLLLLIQGFFAGASIIDYTLERREMNSVASFGFVKRNFLFTVLNGVIFILFFMVPIIGMFMAPLVACVAITRGTLELLDN